MWGGSSRVQALKTGLFLFFSQNSQFFLDKKWNKVYAGLGGGPHSNYSYEGLVGGVSLLHAAADKELTGYL